MSTRFISDTIVGEKVTAKITVDIEDENGILVGAANIGSMVLTLYDRATAAVINGKTTIDIKNLNGGTLADVVVNGVTVTQMTYTLATLDNVMVGSDSREEHVAFFEWTYSAGTKAGRKEVVFTVENFLKVV